MTPLQGIRVVDCSGYIAGAYAGMMLADLGASVVKVEPLEGEAFRELPGFYAWNRGKQSMALNLKSPDGIAVVEKLVRAGDVFLENMRPGVADRLGLGYPRLAEINPRLVYCSVTAFGSSGPYVDRPGFDPLLQAMSGMMALQGYNPATRSSTPGSRRASARVPPTGSTRPATASGSSSRAAISRSG